MIAEVEHTTIWQQLNGIMYAKQQLVQRYIDVGKKVLGEKMNDVDDLMFTPDNAAILFIAGGAVIAAFGKAG